MRHVTKENIQKPGWGAPQISERKKQSLLLRELLIKVFLSGSFKIWLDRLYVLCYSEAGNVRQKSSQISSGGLKKQMSGFGNPI